MGIRIFLKLVKNDRSSHGMQHDDVVVAAAANTTTTTTIATQIIQ
jgi:hypothetical protein